MDPVVLIHIVAGTIAVLAGGTALAVKKGGALHRRAGVVYFWSMLAMAAAALGLSLLKWQPITLIAAVFTSYLVITSWAVVKRRGQKQYLLAMVVALLVAIPCGLAGYAAQTSDTGLYHGYEAVNYFFFGVLALLSAVLDGKAYASKGLAHKHRIARHLWRMCLSYFIAAGSLFTGPGANAFPDVVRTSGILDLPEPAILLLMLFYLARTLITRRKKATPSQG